MWQPIETAPKDARDILCYSDDGWGVFVAMWHPRENVWHTGFEDAMTKAGYTYKIEPTHWMPLPPPPPSV